MLCDNLKIIPDFYQIKLLLILIKLEQYLTFKRNFSICLIVNGDDIFYENAKFHKYYPGSTPLFTEFEG